jgi:hypothetical protein
MKISITIQPCSTDGSRATVGQRGLISAGAFCRVCVLTRAWGRSGINYDGVSGAAAGTFLGSRWLATTALIGTYKTVYGIDIEPSAKVYAL